MCKNHLKGQEEQREMYIYLQAMNDGMIGLATELFLNMFDFRLVFVELHTIVSQYLT